MGFVTWAIIIGVLIVAYILLKNVVEYEKYW
jgi:hypothetical protein